MSNHTIKLLAIDGGGTKTLAVLVNTLGEVLGEGITGASNYHVVGAEGTKQAITTAILAAFREASIEPSPEISIDNAVFAIAGIDTANDAKEVEEIVQQVIQEISIKIDRLQVENDCLSSLLGATMNKPGILLIAGTGSIVFAHDGNHSFVRSGGWGHKLGDEGSGYWIGMQALQSVLKMKDGRGEDTLLAEKLLEKFNFETIDEIYNWAYSESCSVHDIGALGAIVNEAFLHGDKVSKQILDAAVDELFLLVKTAMAEAHIENKECELILQGGVFHNISYIKEQLLQRILQWNKKVKINTANELPIRNIIKRGLNLN